MRIVQFRTEDGVRKVGLVQADELLVLRAFESTFELVTTCLRTSRPIDVVAGESVGSESHPYGLALEEGRVMSPIDHPDPARFWITGTGLTHLGSAKPRDRMHTAAAEEAGKTDTMRMFEMGVAGGRPPAGEVGVQPEWFYKGNGTCVAAPGQPLESPGFGLLDGDEIEVCVFYAIGRDGTPFRIGCALGNEFADHEMEKMNYLYLAHSKLRPCAFGPELLLADVPDEVRGTSRIVRSGAVVWSQPFLSGDRHMSHSLANLEHHLFKYPLFRRPGDLHGHFLGTGTVSFSDGFHPDPGDVFEMEAECFGRPLRNPLVRGDFRAEPVTPLYSSDR